MEKRDYTEFQKNVNEKAGKIFENVLKNEENMQLDNLASMEKRLIAYIIDSVLVGTVMMAIFFVMMVPVSSFFMGDFGTYEYSMNSSSMGAMSFGFLGFFPLMILLSGLSFFTMIFTWATNGYTPGKWFVGIRVIKHNGEKISFLDAFLRELLIKSILNSMFSGFLNVGSFIWGYMTPDHKTLQDVVVKTTVVNKNTPEVSEKSNHKNPLEY